jgi:hypothetical protein
MIEYILSVQDAIAMLIRSHKPVTPMSIAYIRALDAKLRQATAEKEQAQ